MPEISPPTVSVLALTVIVEFAPSVTAPVPMFNVFEPAKVKLPFQFCALFPLSVRAAVTSSVPLLITILPEAPPNAESLPRIKRPVFKVTSPVKVFEPEIVRSPAPFLVKPPMLDESITLAKAMFLPLVSMTMADPLFLKRDEKSSVMLPP